jgi:hypothetical protein
LCCLLYFICIFLYSLFCFTLKFVEVLCEFIDLNLCLAKFFICRTWCSLSSSCTFCLTFSCIVSMSISMSSFMISSMRNFLWAKRTHPKRRTTSQSL